MGLGEATNWKSEKLAATILAGDLRNEGSGSTMSTIYRSIKAMDLTKPRGTPPGICSSPA